MACSTVGSAAGDQAATDRADPPDALVQAVLIAILGGLGAALAWAVSTLCSARSSRILDPSSVIGWMMLVGLLLAAPVALLEGVPSMTKDSAGLWLALAGAGNVIGLMFEYSALRIGKTALVVPIASTEGAMAAAIAFAAGERMPSGVLICLALIVVGIVFSSLPPESGGESESLSHGRPIVLAVACTLAFGGSLYAAGRAGQVLPGAWIAVAARAVGVPAITIPLALTGRLRLNRDALPLVVIAGLSEVLGFYAFSAGGRHGIAVAAVLSSQFGTISVVFSWVVLHERLSRFQMIGVLGVIGGVAALSGFSV
jgi:drug/metabolite transporter (DMT)-like permease